MDMIATSFDIAMFLVRPNAGVTPAAAHPAYSYSRTQQTDLYSILSAGSCRLGTQGEESESIHTRNQHRQGPEPRNPGSECGRRPIAVVNKPDERCEHPTCDQKRQDHR